MAQPGAPLPQLPGRRPAAGGRRRARRAHPRHRASRTGQDPGGDRPAPPAAARGSAVRSRPGPHPAVGSDRQAGHPRRTRSRGPGSPIGPRRAGSPGLRPARVPAGRRALRAGRRDRPARRHRRRPRPGRAAADRAARRADPAVQTGRVGGRRAQPVEDPPQRAPEPRRGAADRRLLLQPGGARAAARAARRRRGALQGSLDAGPGGSGPAAPGPVRRRLLRPAAGSPLPHLREVRAFPELARAAIAMGPTKRPDGTGPEPALFDLPLADSRRRGDELQAAPAAAATGNLPLFAPGAAAEPRPLAAPRAGSRAEAPPAPLAEAPPAPLAARLVAGLADLAVHAALLAAAIFGARLLGV